MVSIAIHTIEPAIRVSTSGENHRPSGAAPAADASSVIECPAANATMIGAMARTLRNGTTRQIRNSTSSVPWRHRTNPSSTKLPRRLIPARVETHETGVPGVVERPLLSLRREKVQHGGRVDSEPRQPRMNRKLRTRRLNPIFEQRVNDGLRPVQPGSGGQPWTGDVRESGAYRRTSDPPAARAPRRHDAAPGSCASVLVEIELCAIQSIALSASSG